jgi:hypothetical protein
MIQRRSSPVKGNVERLLGLVGEELAGVAVLVAGEEGVVLGVEGSLDGPVPLLGLGGVCW